MLRMKKKLALLLAVILVLTALIYHPFVTQAAPITSDSIREKEEQLKQAEKEKEALQNSLTNVKEIKKKLEAEQKDLQSYVAQLDAQLAAIQENIAYLNAQIAEKEREIAETQAELEAARKTEQAQYEAMVERIQMLYEEGDSTYLDIFFSGESFGSILNQMEYMEQIFAYDRQQMDSFIMTRQMIELCEEELLIEKDILDETREGVLAEEAAIEELIEEKAAKLNYYASSIQTKEAAIRDYEAYIQEQEEMAKALEAAIAEEKKKLLAQNGSVITYDGGQFKFPMAYYTYISSPYGDRIDPISGIQSFHNGVDFAAPTGTAIYAAYDGKVVAAAYSSSMGNYIMIDHGDGLYTIYMHASKLYVSEGTIVVRGETIAAVGATGRVTGPHLHFTVRLNGSYVSPWNYLSQ